MLQFTRKPSHRETLIIEQAEKEFRASMLRELSLQRFHIPWQSLSMYQRMTVKILYNQLVQQLKVWQP